MRGDKSHFGIRRVVALLLTLAFSFTSTPTPAAFAAKPERNSSSINTVDAVLPESTSSLGEKQSTVQSQVGVLSGHSWAKTWDPEIEELVLQALEAKKAASRSSTLSEDLTDHLKQTQPADDPTNPVAAGLEESLRAGAEEPRGNRGRFWKGVATGAVITGALAGAYEVGQRTAVAPPAVQPPAKVAPIEPERVPVQPAPEKPAPPIKPEVPAKPAPEKPEQVIPPAPVKSPFLDQTDKALVQKMQVWWGKTRRFFAGQKMGEAVDAPGGFSVRAYASYKPQEDHKFNRYLGVQRFWAYDMGVTMTYLIQRGEVDEAKWLANQMIDIAKQMDKNGEKGGWRFSYGETFTDSRAMSGGTAWVFQGLYTVALQTRDKALLDWTNKKFVEVAFAQQVMDSKDPRYGLFRAGFGTGGPEGNDESNKQREEITTEHNWDYITALRLAYRATKLIDPESPLLKELNRRHLLAMQYSRAQLRLTPGIVQAQMDRLKKQGRLTAELRKQHEKAIEEIKRLPVQSRWATGMDRDGTMNLSWAWDNEGWSPHGAYDPELGYYELKNLETRFLIKLKAKDFSNLPKGVDPNQEFIGLIFFTGDFVDPHVPANPVYERMIQPEATWSYIFRLIQFGYYTDDPAQKTWAYGLAQRLIDSMLRLSEIYEGSPYATKDIQGYFNTMLAIASNGHQGAVLEAVLQQATPATDYLNALPHPDMEVNGRSAAWVVEKETPRKIRPPQPAPKPKEQPAKPKAEEKSVELPNKADVGGQGLALKLPKELVGKWAVGELKTDQFYPQSSMGIPEDGEVSFEARYEEGSDRFPGWAKAAGRRILIYENEDASRKGSGAALFIINIGRPDERGKAAATMAKAGLEESRGSFIKGVLAGAVTVAAIYGAFKLGQWVQAPQPAPPAQVAPVEPAPVQPKPPVAEQPVQPPVAPPQPKPVQLEKAEVTPERLSMKLPKEIKGWVQAYLGTDLFYPQEQIHRVTDGGEVAFDVPVAPPNRPGWKEANGRGIAIFETEEDAARARSVNALKAIPAPLVISIAKDGTPTVVKGTLPTTLVQPPAEKPGIAPKKEEEKPAPPVAPAPGANVMTPLKDWVAADAKRELPIIIWDPRELTQKDLSGFFDLVAKKGGVTSVYISGYRFLDLKEDQQRAILDQASKAGLRTLGFIDGDVGWLKDTTFMKERVYGPVMDRLMALKPHEYGLKVAFGFDVEMHTQKGYRGTQAEYTAYARAAREAVDLVKAFAQRYQREHGKQVVSATWLVRFEHGSYSTDRMLGTGIDLSETALAGMTYWNTEGPLGRAASRFQERAKKEGKGMQAWFGVEFQEANIVGGPQLTFHGREKRAPEVVLRVWKDNPELNGAFLHFGSPKQAQTVFQHLTGATDRMPSSKAGERPAPEEASAVKIDVVKLKDTELSLTLTGVPDGSLASAWIENKKGEPGVWYIQPIAYKTEEIQKGKVVLTNEHEDERRNYKAGRIRVVIVKDDAAMKAFIDRLKGDQTYFNEDTIRRLIGDAEFVRRVGLTVIEIKGADRGEVLKADAGLEEISRRTFLRQATVGAITATLVPEFYGLTQAQVAQPGPVGALAPLREKLGADRQLGIIVWDPRDLLRLRDFFSLAVKAGVDTVWISGYRFRQLPAAQQQTILTQASRSGLRTFGFIDGDKDWDEPRNRQFVANHYRQLTGQLARLNLGKLKVAFATDVEPHTKPKWNGDLKPSMDLIEGVILPQIKQFAQAKKGAVQGPLLTRFEPWWYENGRETDDGATVKGIRAIKDTDIAAMTYRDSAESIDEVSKVVRDRTKKEEATFQIGVETLPAKEVGAPSFSGKETEIGPALVGAYEAMPKEDQDRLRGVYIHTRAPAAAHRILSGIVKAKADQPKKPAQPAKEFGVKGGKATRFTALEIALELLLPKELADKRLVAVPFVQTDTWYLQPFDDQRAMHPVGVDGKVTVRTVGRSPFKGGATQGRAVMLLERAQFNKFLEAYKARGARAAGKLSLRTLVIQDDGKVEVAEELPRSGLEELEQIIRPQTRLGVGDLLLYEGVEPLAGVYVISALEGGEYTIVARQPAPDGLDLLDESFIEIDRTVLDWNRDWRYVPLYRLVEEAETHPESSFRLRLLLGRPLDEIEQLIAATANRLGVGAFEPGVYYASATVDSTAPVASVAVQRFVGLFKDGDPNQLVTDSDVGARLNTEAGKKETFVVEVDPAALPQVGRVFRQTGASVPESLQQIASRMVELPTDLTQAEGMLLAEQADSADVAFVTEEAVQIAPAEWDRLFRDYRLPGVRFTPKALQDMRDKNLTLADLAAILAAVRSTGGLVAVLGIEVEQRTTGERRLFIYA